MARRIKKTKVKKKFIAIGKIGNNPQGRAICYKHWTNNVERYLAATAPRYKFLWINFYYNTGESAGMQFASWTKNLGYFTNVRPSKL